ncbi:uncharacterized protein LOC127842788 isoform X2 [Dreissena polymorpha]|uniref:Uncharacterized protein n=1 Tax=Dreissena polymorpha TaxID=45954 RepID=A0A9D4IRQ7_DREPO|nr:uncharacterized protein LOC127842788 isoform X2 [Dreissena polymorpha]KAH3782557.1 hypothetical protein DPMN_160474 [Dreissena polymorpha]
MWQQPGSQDIQSERVHQRHLFAESPLFIIDLRESKKLIVCATCRMMEESTGSVKDALNGSTGNVLVSQWNQKSTSAHHVHTSEPYYSVVKQLRGVKDPNLKAYLAKDK